MDAISALLQKQGLSAAAQAIKSGGGTLPVADAKCLIGELERYVEKTEGHTRTGDGDGGGPPVRLPASVEGAGLSVNETVALAIKTVLSQEDRHLSREQLDNFAAVVAKSPAFQEVMTTATAAARDNQTRTDHVIVTAPFDQQMEQFADAAQTDDEKVKDFLTRMDNAAAATPTTATTLTPAANQSSRGLMRTSDANDEDVTRRGGDRQNPPTFHVSALSPLSDTAPTRGPPLWPPAGNRGGEGTGAAAGGQESATSAFYTPRPPGVVGPDDEQFPEEFLNDDDPGFDVTEYDEDELRHVEVCRKRHPYTQTPPRVPLIGVPPAPPHQDSAFRHPIPTLCPGSADEADAMSITPGGRSSGPVALSALADDELMFSSVAQSPSGRGGNDVGMAASMIDDELGHSCSGPTSDGPIASLPPPPVPLTVSSMDDELGMARNETDAVPAFGGDDSRAAEFGPVAVAAAAAAGSMHDRSDRSTHSTSPTFGASGAEAPRPPPVAHPHPQPSAGDLGPLSPPSGQELDGYPADMDDSGGEVRGEGGLPSGATSVVMLDPSGDTVYFGPATEDFAQQQEQARRDADIWAAEYSNGSYTTNRQKRREDKYRQLGKGEDDATRSGPRFPPSQDPFYPCDDKEGVTYDSFPLRVVYDRYRTGFEEQKEFPVTEHMEIAGRYHVHRYIGSAAFSKALAALDKATNSWVCLKVIKPEKDFIDQSLDEIKLLRYINCNGNVDNHHCLKLVDYFYHREHLIIVTELLKMNLYEFQKTNRENQEVDGDAPYFTMGRIQLITKQVLEALAFTHRLCLVHCDLKPENILFKSYGRVKVKVIDFGSSCFIDDVLSHYVQSRSYRAPEVLLGLPYDSKIDIWSLGCIVAELWMGTVLFQNDCLTSMLSRIASIVGPIPWYLFAKGKQVRMYFTSDGSLARKVDTPHSMVGGMTASGATMAPHIAAQMDMHSSGAHGGRRYVMYLPKKSSLRSRMRCDDDLFVDFVSQCLQIDPVKRLTAAAALQHPFITQAKYPDGL